MSVHSSSSRSSTDDSHVGLLNEKRPLDDQERTSGLATWSTVATRNEVVTSRPCLPLRQLGRIFKHSLYILLPTFLQPYRHNALEKFEPLPPTAFLDSCRGLAAFVVMLTHILYGTFNITYAWGANPESSSRYSDQQANREFLRLPIVRLLYSGPPMVQIFFVISGYALSYKPLKLMRSGLSEKLMTTMTSSIFRRGMRLFLPCFASTFIVICLAQLNLYKMTEDFAENMRVLPEDHCYTQPNLWLQFVDWLQQMLIFVNVFDWSLYAGSVELDRHLWTIPVEFRCSMALFLTQMAVARMSTRLRISTFTLLIIWGVSWGRWDLCPFLAGAVIAELDIIWSSTSADLPTTTVPKTPRRRNLAANVIHCSTLLVSLFLLSYPDAAGHATPGYVTLTKLIPSGFTEMHRFWPTIGAILIIWSLSRIDFLRRVLCWSPLQYLGKISFPLYVMHGPIIHTFGYLILPKTPKVETPEIMRQFEFEFLKSSILVVFTVIWAVDVFLRVVDTPCVALTKKLERMLFVT
ncbi:acyltransferase family-domain-containing protein [Exophiala viscosa]|uniref:acyltransferase family-domain-containing protein n=1 Tax=Exophiala viscosa TaxID=2486360 RepID=UPI00219E52B9|nr:acyltransferase family-domain-containing protein [Exophiala viscosa]